MGAHKPLGVVRQIMQAVGFEPGYAYDDLVFSEDAIFLVQFHPKDDNILKLFLNKDCETPEAERIKSLFTEYARQVELAVEHAGKFTMSQKEGSEEIELVFMQ